MNSPRAVLLNSSVSLCLLPVILSRTNETIFHSPYTLPSSVSCKSFACHSYENCRVYTNNSHSGSHQVQPRGTRHSSLVTCTQVLSYHSVAHSFALEQVSTLFFSSDSALFAKNHPACGVLRYFSFALRP